MKKLSFTSPSLRTHYNWIVCFRGLAVSVLPAPHSTNRPRIWSPLPMSPLCASSASYEFHTTPTFGLAGNGFSNISSGYHITRRQAMYVQIIERLYGESRYSITGSTKMRQFYLISKKKETYFSKIFYLNGFIQKKQNNYVFSFLNDLLSL